MAMVNFAYGYKKENLKAANLEESRHQEDGSEEKSHEEIGEKAASAKKEGSGKRRLEEDRS
jgi:hypothetical protein